MKAPTLSIARIMAAIVVLAFDLTLIRTALSKDFGYIELFNRTVTVGGLMLHFAPIVMVAQVGIGMTLIGRRCHRPFWIGLVSCCLTFGPACLWSAHARVPIVGKWVQNFLASFGKVMTGLPFLASTIRQSGVLSSSAVAVYLLIPQLTVAILAGALAATVGRLAGKLSADSLPQGFRRSSSPQTPPRDVPD